MERLNFLAIDTSTNILKIALSIEGKDSYIDLKNDFKHIENLLPCIDSCLKKINEPKTKLNYIGVCTGPGSFTGIRIGIAAALGMSYAGKIKCFGFSVFDVYKYLLKEEKKSIIIPIIDAKKNRFYCSFINNNKYSSMYDIGLDDIINKLKKYKHKKLIFTGKDFRLIKNNISKGFDFVEKYIEDYASMDLLYFTKIVLNDKLSLIKPKPIYLRKSEAEIALLKEKNKK